MRFSFFLLFLAYQATCDSSMTIWENMQNQPQLSKLVNKINTTEFEDVKHVLDSAGTFTLFAPSNDAITDSAAVTHTLLAYHVLPSTLHRSDMVAKQFVTTTLNSTDLPADVTARVLLEYDGNITAKGGVKSVDAWESKSEGEEISCSNGVINTVDTVFGLPTTIISEVLASSAYKATFSTLKSQLDGAGLSGAVDAAPGITVLAPSDAAFLNWKTASLFNKNEVTQVLEYHVLQGVFFSTDLQRKNGQKIDTLDGAKVKITVVAPTPTQSPTRAPTASPTAPPTAPTSPTTAPTAPPTAPTTAPPTATTAPTTAPPTAPTTAPPTAPTNPPTAPTTAPPTAPTNPPTAPTNPPTAPTNPPTAPTAPTTTPPTSAPPTPKGTRRLLSMLNQQVGNTPGYIMVGNARVELADIQIANGVVHECNAVIIPPVPDNSTINKALKYIPECEDLTVLIETDAKYQAVKNLLAEKVAKTLILPTDTAVAAAIKAGNLDPKNVAATTEALQYHTLKEDVKSMDLKGVKVVETFYQSSHLINQSQVVVFDKIGDKYTVNGVDIVKADYTAIDGTIHSLSEVLSVPVSEADTLVERGLTNLIDALEANNLTDVLANMSSYTLLAPSNKAFTECGLADADVANALKRHVFEGVVYSSDLTNDQKLTSIGGDTYTVTVDAFGHVLTIGGIKVTTANILTDSGVVHEIEYLLGCGPDNADSGIKWWEIVLIIGGVIAVVAAVYCLFCNKKNQHSESLFDNDDHSGYVKYGTTSNNNE